MSPALAGVFFFFTTSTTWEAHGRGTLAHKPILPPGFLHFPAILALHPPPPLKCSLKKSLFLVASFQAVNWTDLKMFLKGRFVHWVPSGFLPGRKRQGGGWGSMAVVLSVPEKECPTSRLWFAKLLTDKPRSVVVWCLGQPKLENHTSCPTSPSHLPLYSSCPQDWCLGCTGSVPLPVVHTWRAEAGLKPAPWACCGAAGSPTRGCCWSERVQGEGAEVAAVREAGRWGHGGSSSQKDVPQGECSGTRDPCVPEASFPSPHTSWRPVSIRLLIGNPHFAFGSTNSSRKPVKIPREEPICAQE